MVAVSSRKHLLLLPSDRICGMAIRPETTQTIETYTFWQFRLSETGSAATDLDEISQAVRIILTTPKGSVPHRPDFASSIYDYLDLPLNVVRSRIVEDVTTSLIRFEPRIEVRSVLVTSLSGIGEKVRVRVEYLVTEVNVRSFVEVNF